jgi:hypothetical protein
VTCGVFPGPDVCRRTRLCQPNLGLAVTDQPEELARASPPFAFSGRVWYYRPSMEFDPFAELRRQYGPATAPPPPLELGELWGEPRGDFAFISYQDAMAALAGPGICSPQQLAVAMARDGWQRCRAGWPQVRGYRRPIRRGRTPEAPEAPAGSRRSDVGPA